jgi:hypothetical protein
MSGANRLESVSAEPFSPHFKTGRASEMWTASLRTRPVVSRTCPGLRYPGSTVAASRANAFATSRASSARGA